MPPAERREPRAGSDPQKCHENQKSDGREEENSEEAIDGGLSEHEAKHDGLKGEGALQGKREVI